MMKVTTKLDVEPIIEPGSSAADAIGQALDRAQTQREIDAILIREIPYTTTITDFDRLGRIKSRNGGVNDRFDQKPVEVTITDSIVRGITNTVSTSIGGSLSATVQSGIKAGIPGGGEASVSTSVTGTVEASKTVTTAVQTQLSRSVGIKETLDVTFRAEPCFERNNPYGLCLEITVTGMIQFKQDASLVRGSDGTARFRLQNSGTIIGLSVDDVDVSLDPCVMPDPSPKPIPGCKQSERVAFRLPLDKIDGIGDTLAGKLRDDGIFTIDDLATIDVGRTVDGIPRTTLLALRAKAQMVAATGASVRMLGPVADRTVADILNAPPEILTAAIGDDVSTDMLNDARDQLSTLLVTMDSAAVRDMPLTAFL